MSDPIKRRDFVRLLSLGSIGSSLPLPALSRTSGLDDRQASAEAKTTASSPYSGEFFKFSPNGEECIIQRPDTPVPWMNLLANDTYLTWITHRGHIECALLDRSINGLTNPQETSGLVYIRDRTSGEYFCINTPRPGSTWQCRHGLGYTVITTSALGLIAEVIYFVPRNDNLVVWSIKVRNQHAASREVDIFSTVEWNLGDQNKILLFAGHGGGGDAYTGGSQFNLFKKAAYEDGVIYANQPVWRSLGANAKPWPYTGFMASSVRPTSYECVKQNFLGAGRTLDNPREVENGQCDDHQLWSDNEFPWGAFHHRIHLDGTNTQSLVILTGMARNRETITHYVDRYATVSKAQQSLTEVKTFWKDFLNRTIHIQSPEPKIDRNLNIWTKYQWRNNMLRSMTTNRYGLGFWSYGLLSGTSGGTLTEVVAQPHDLKIIRDAVIQFMSLQYQNTGQGKLYEEAPLMAASDLGRPWPPPKTRGPFQYPHSHETDSIYPIAHYILESGDFSFLDRKIPYLDSGEDTAFEHISTALKYATQGLSERALPRLCIGIGDWNDELNGLCKEGKAESVMMAMELCYHLRECANVATRYGREEKAAEWMNTYGRIKDACNRYAWDGEWYVRAFTDRGSSLRPIGTSSDKEGSIYLNTQSLAVLSGVAEGQRTRQCMESVGKHLISQYGPLLLAPAYTKFDPQIGIQSAYAPGWRNANVYFRPTGWAVMAACIADLPELAFDMYKKACISEQSTDVLRFLNEPYAYSENVNGPDHPMAGAAQYQWNLGEGANWMWHSYVYYILGVRPVMDGLLVDPRIPSSWPGFSVQREFRHAKYEIYVDNPTHLNKGVRRMMIDGKPTEGNIIPAFSDGKLHRVEAVIQA